MNAERKWTPGPWQLRGKFIYATGSVDTWSGPVSGAIATCEETEQTDAEGRVWSAAGDALANAHLIAAAPDMYEALQEALELAELATELTGCRGDDDYVWGLRDKLKAVLSKANGAAS